jgi:S-DNA-T family DNA segregation ATPase FtsK/SpoIIIE
MIWISIFLGYFSYSVNYLGGTFGFYLNEWMILTIGKIGTISLLIMSFYVLTAIQFNPNFAALFSYFKNDNSNDSDIENEERKNTNEYEDILVVNTIKEEQIKKDAVSETVDFSDEDDAEFDESELIVTIKEDDDFEIEIGQEPNEKPIKSDSITEKVTSKHGEEDVLAAGLVAEFGEYDPKKDLDGYILPPIDLLRDFGNKDISINKEELESNKNKIVQTLSHYKIDIAKIKATVGPTVTLYEIVPAPGVRISKIKNLEDDIALSLSALGIRIIAPIPGKGTIGIEVPNSNPEMVSMHSLISSDKFQNFDGELPVVLGRTITNETYVFDLTKLPHLLVAGSTGQGKSVERRSIRPSRPRSQLLPRLITASILPV